MSNTRNHHYVSQFYLKGFSKNGGTKAKLFVYDKEQRKYFQSNPRNIASKRDFNRISAKDSENYIEDHQANMESKFASVFRNLTESREYPDDEDLSYILTFIALISLRNPKTRAIFDKFYIDIAEKFNSITMASEEIYIDKCLQAGIKKEDIIPYEKQKEFIDNKNRYTLSINQEIHIQAEHQNIDYLSELLHKRYWYLIKSDETIGEFITSDYPVSLISLVKLPKIYGVGFGMQKTEVCFPISKYLALIGVFEEYDNIDKTIIATKELIETINLRTYSFTYKQVYSTKQINFDLSKDTRT
ncbi:DUF4238 domain-containing protein [Sulfurimonas sp. CS5]|uniref:DUF4238 domain-containing protein n=1 Tax=Sulfurimonas sp. CS5 TaxID=3391145 RepID=UPI0039E7660D